MHDPMAMRPFMGYNFGSADHKFLWPGYGDNIRVIDWILRRCSGDTTIAEETPIGFVPKKGMKFFPK
uniref:Phosphoenolpyruvate carboxykinase C-terminal P-loop domain-containing protein n=1 Tax=Parascaris equorum TaxID=6256 RepID=A0A914RX47_PAREQ